MNKVGCYFSPKSGNAPQYRSWNIPGRCPSELVGMCQLQIFRGAAPWFIGNKHS
jgi:hypothetical protein